MSQSYVSIMSVIPINTPRSDVVVVAIRAYFDGSGKSNDPQSRFLTLAGYVGTVGAWQRFEERWNNVLERWRCKYLHMREATQLRGEFSEEKGWTNEKVNQLLGQLFNECLSTTGWGDFKGKFRGVACSINLDHYRQVSSIVHGLKEPEAICVDFVMTVAIGSLLADENNEGLVAVIFDKGEKFIHTVHRIWVSKPRHKLVGPLRHVFPIAQDDSNDTCGLQAADLLAWRSNTYYTNYYTNIDRMDINGQMTMRAKLAQRQGFMRFFSTPTFAHYYDYEELMSYAKKKGLFPLR